MVADIQDVVAVAQAEARHQPLSGGNESLCLAGARGIAPGVRRGRRHHVADLANEAAERVGAGGIVLHHQRQLDILAQALAGRAPAFLDRDAVAGGRDETLDQGPVEAKQHQGLDSTVGVGVQFLDRLEAAGDQSPAAVRQSHLLAGQIDEAGEALPDLRRGWGLCQSRRRGHDRSQDQPAACDGAHHARPPQPPAPGRTTGSSIDRRRGPKRCQPYSSAV